MADVTKKWYVVRAISGQEKKIKSYIEVEVRRNKLDDHVSQILIPTEKIYQIRKGKKVKCQQKQKDSDFTVSSHN